MADFATLLGIGYTGGSLLLFTCLMAVLGAWYRSEGSIAVETVNTPKVEAFYWAAITFSQTLGTALGDWAADTGGLGYEGARLVFGAGLASPPRCTIGLARPASLSSGRHSFSRVRWEQHSEISSTNLSTMAALP